MKVGKLRHVVQVQTYSPSISKSGETVRTWTKVADVFADVRPVSAREILSGNAEKLQGEITHTVTIRFLAGVMHKMRVIWEGKTLEVVGVIPDRTNKIMLQLTCKELA